MKKVEAYKTIGEVAKELNLIDKNSGKTMTHTLRFWEKNFKQIKPKIFSGRRRYYDIETVNILKKIQYLLKVKGLTINGVKRALNSNQSFIDEYDNLSINAKRDLKKKINKISDLIKSIKQN
tara:strand:- start:251 stop:616 length:366 start_codon:yes stop_codon:yes gene_type:complete